MMNKDAVAQAVVTQQITLATAVTTLTLTFYKNFTPSNATNGVPSHGQAVLLVIAWIVLGLSILVGVVTLMVLVNAVPKVDSPGATLAADDPKVFVPAMGQTLLFIAGLGLMLAAVITVL
jgi:hypothetical protein